MNPLRKSEITENVENIPIIENVASLESVSEEPIEIQLIKPSIETIPLSEIAVVPIEEEVVIPYAEAFWDYYFTQHQINNDKTFLGDENKKEKFIGLLGEINDYLLNADKIDITKPIQIEQETGCIYYIGDTHGSIKDTDKIIHYFVQKIEKALEQNIPLKIIFLGDYVDRNDFDIHNLCYILAFALKYRALYSTLARKS